VWLLVRKTGLSSRCTRPVGVGPRLRQVGRQKSTLELSEPPGGGLRVEALRSQMIYLDDVHVLRQRSSRDRAAARPFGRGDTLVVEYTIRRG